MEAHRAIEAKARSEFVQFHTLHSAAWDAMPNQEDAPRKFPKLHDCNVADGNCFDRIIASIYVESAMGAKPGIILTRAGWHLDQSQMAFRLNRPAGG